MPDTSASMPRVSVACGVSRVGPSARTVGERPIFGFDLPWSNELDPQSSARPLISGSRRHTIRSVPSFDLPAGDGVGGVLQELCEGLRELGDVIERLDRRPVAVGAGHDAQCKTASYRPNR